MNLTTTHKQAAQTSAYDLVMTGRTNGIQNIGPDINAYNSYGMTPVQVALQAGDEAELAQILANPACDPLKKPRNPNVKTFDFVEIYKMGAGFTQAADEKAARMIAQVRAAAYYNNELRVLQEQNAPTLET